MNAITKTALVTGRDSRPVELANAEFLKAWTARHTSLAADGWFRADFDDSNWGRYQADELAERTGGYGGGFEQATTRALPDLVFQSDEWTRA